MKKFCLFAVFATVLILSSCAQMGRPGQKSQTEIVWSAKDIFEGWVYHHQDTSTVYSAWLDKDTLCLATRANTYDRTKMHTRESFGAGVYRWMTYIPALPEGDQTSVGSWIYCDDHHEIDFEVGWGKDAARAEAGCKPGQMVACMTNQDFPFTSSYVAIDPGWHEFEINLEVKDGKYVEHWSIDGVEKKKQAVGFGPETRFHVEVSVENLKFIGTHMATAYNVGRYQWVSYSSK